MALFGVETEYGLAAPGPEADRRRNAAVAGELVEEIRRWLPSLPAEGKAGAFVASEGFAGVVYLDRDHLEVATNEADDPLDVVRFTLAGHCMVEQAIARRYPDPARRPTVFVSSVCLTNRVSFGCHENYLYRADASVSDPRDLLIPHLSTRTVFSGSGGLDPSPGVSFVISPRALFLVVPRSTSSMKGRGIADDVEEPLRATQYRRFHVLAGDPVLAEIPGYLKVGSTALVLELTQAGVCPRESVALADPVAAMHAIARDPSCRLEVALANGGSASAVTIQRRFLEAAQAHLDAPWMPTFAAAVCREWRRVLDMLDRDPAAACTVLDWAIKREIFGRVLARHQMDWTAMAAWTDALRALWARLRPGDSPEALPPPEVLLEPRARRRARAAGAVAVFKARGLAWTDLPRFLECRRALFESDIRFGELSDKSLFRQLDRAGVLNHHVVGIDGLDIDRANAPPPATGRARVRGEAIQRLAGGRPFICDWDRICDPSSGAWFDLTDPLDPAAQWRSANGKPIPGNAPDPLPTPPPAEPAFMRRGRESGSGALWAYLEDGPSAEGG